MKTLTQNGRTFFGMHLGSQMPNSHKPLVFSVVDTLETIAENTWPSLVFGSWILSCCHIHQLLMLSMLMIRLLRSMRFVCEDSLTMGRSLAKIVETTCDEK